MSTQIQKQNITFNYWAGTIGTVAKRMAFCATCRGFGPRMELIFVWAPGSYFGFACAHDILCIFVNYTHVTRDILFTGSIMWKVFFST